MMLTGRKIRLRALEPDDLSVLHRWENDESLWLVSGTMVPFSRYSLKNYIEKSLHDIYAEKQLRLVIERLGKKRIQVGCIDLFDYDPRNHRAGIGILIGEARDRGKGYADEALQLLIGYAFDVLHLHQLFCNILEDNKASFRLFKKHGFREAGCKKDWIYHHGKWMDEYFLQLVRK